MANNQLHALAYFIGSWTGEGQSQPGTSQVEISFAWTLGGRFVESRNRATFPAQEKNRNGELHEDQGIFSYDRVRKLIVLRQFHTEGFVNQYVLTGVSDDGRELVFETEAIENIPAGFQARTTYRIVGEHEFLSIFELAAPGADFAVYSQNRLRRK